MIVTSPWPYILVDDFLTPDDFARLSAHPVAHVKATERESLLNNQVHADGRIVANDLSKEFIAALHERYHERSMEWLKQLAPKKVPLYEYADYELVITGSQCKFPIHDDTWDKLLSIVVYLAPEENAGTIVYDNRKGNNPTNVAWKQNRALIFSRREGRTWHGYKGDGRNNRLALVYNLMTNDIRGVYKAEGISYTMTRARKRLESLAKLVGRKKYRPA